MIHEEAIQTLKDRVQYYEGRMRYDEINGYEIGSRYWKSLVKRVEHSISVLERLQSEEINKEKHPNNPPKF